MTTLAPPEPLSSLRHELAAARDQGADFASAWPTAVRIVLRNHHGNNFARREWIVAIRETKLAWQEAFERTGDPVAWASVVDLVDELGAAPHRLLA